MKKFFYDLARKQRNETITDTQLWRNRLIALVGLVVVVALYLLNNP